MKVSPCLVVTHDIVASNDVKITSYSIYTADAIIKSVAKSQNTLHDYLALNIQYLD